MVGRSPPLLADSARPAPFRILLVNGNADWSVGVALWVRQRADLDLVGVALSSQQAEDLLSRGRPELVIVDQGASGIDVLEFTRRVRTRPEAPAVVLVTLVDSAVARAAAAEAGALALLHKSEITERLAPLIASLRAARGAC